MVEHSKKYKALADHLEVKLSSAHLPGAERLSICDAVVELIALAEKEAYLEGIAEGLLMSEIRNGKIRGHDAEFVMKYLKGEEIVPCSN